MDRVYPRSDARFARAGPAHQGVQQGLEVLPLGRVERREERRESLVDDLLPHRQDASPLGGEAVVLATTPARTALDESFPGDVRFVLVPAAGHLPHIEQPAAIHAIVDPIVARTD